MEPENKPQFKLSDELIGQIAKSLQMALLTGTSIVDNFRLIRVTPSDSAPAELVMTQQFSDKFEETIGKMLAEAERLSKPVEAASPSSDTN